MSKWLLMACLMAFAVASPAQDEVTELPLNEFRPASGDLDEIVERRRLRVLVPYGRTLYFIDGGTQRGIAFEIMQGFEEVLNERFDRDHLRVEVVFIPTTRDRLIPALVEGLGDIVAANLTITPERAERVDFTVPLGRGVREVLVAHAGAEVPAGLEDLSGQELFVNPQSSYFEHLESLNQRFADQGLAPIQINEAPDHFETEDVLEMVNAGLVDYTFADSYLAAFWQQVLPDLQVIENVSLSDGNDIAFAVRQDSPQLLALANEYLATTRKGTATGNILFRRYYQNTSFVTNATAKGERNRLLELAELFQLHAAENRLDWLMITAQGYQESRLDHSVVSPVGAIGVMQVLPTTAADMGISDVTDLEGNIQAGVRYVRYLIDSFFDDPDIEPADRVLLALASYNAGPGRIRTFRRIAAERGLDPNRWFNNVEHIAAEKIGRETVQYVSNIYKYYTAYRLVEAQGLLQ
ncbi:transglycosylase SLT domain-containing protein [Wenzhouxiangella limi]|nr:transporter substrate-binding domain-containing protein [Wenzhouxiangella limi]